METKRSCIVIDDESKAISVLTNTISKIPELDLIAGFNNPFEALIKIPEIKPDIVFTDIDMPNKNGFEVVDEIRMMGLKPYIVFTTGFNQYAIKAIKKQAYDYLLKPITKSDILSVLAKVDYSSDNKPVNKEQSTTNGKIRFNTLSGFYVIEVSNIAYVKADGNYSEIYLKNGTSRLLTSNLAHIGKLLENYSFKRIGRSIIINIDCLTQVDRKHCICILDTGSAQVKLPISRKNIRELAELF